MMNVDDRIAAARLRKVHNLVSALRSVGAKAEDLDLADFPWDDTCKLAGTRPPSDESKRMVRETLEFLEDCDRRKPSDPFEGL